MKLHPLDLNAASDPYTNKRDCLTQQRFDSLAMNEFMNLFMLNQSSKSRNGVDSTFLEKTRVDSSQLETTSSSMLNDTF